ncbi:MAG: hypothetical protein ACRD0C_04600 [Acidimicrobiia bacterium]
MTKRLGSFLALGLFGVLLLLGGLAWDAVLHAADPTLAGREGLLTVGNPGHVLLGLGMAAVVIGLLGAAATTLAMSGSGRLARPVVRHAFLAGSLALVVASAAVTSWSATAGRHDPGAVHAAAHDRDGLPGTTHGHAELAAAVGDVSAGHGHGAGALEGTVEEAHGHPSASVPAAHSHEMARGAATDAGAHDHLPAAPTAGEAAHVHGEPASGVPGALPAAAPLPDPEVTEVRYGPFALGPAGAGGDLDFGNVVMPNVPKPCDDCFILAAEPDLIYPDGSSANLDTGVMLHHAVFFNPANRDTTCGDDEFFRNLGERFLASGNERTKRRFPPGFGYHLGAGPVNAVFHVMNHSSEPKTVYFRYRVTWLPGTTEGIRPVTPVWLDMANCRTSEYSVPAGPSSSHWTWKSTITGRIIWTAGHVHDGGIRTTLTNASTGRHVCTAWAGYGTKPAYMGTIESMSTCAWDALGTVREGETLDLESVYNAREAANDVMGIMVAYVWQTPDLEGGTPAPPEATGDVPAPPTSTPPAENPHPHHH